MVFPITVSSPNDEIKDRVYMQTSCTLSESGELNISIHSWTSNLMTGAHSRAIIYLFDENGKRLWNTDELACGIGGTLESSLPIFDKSVKSDRTENYSFNVPLGFVSQVQSIKIVHFDKAKTVTGYLQILNKIFDMNEPQPDKIFHVSGNYYNQDRVAIGHNEGGVKDNAKVAVVLNEAKEPDLAEVAAEIQQLLEQLEKSYPTNTTGKMALATEAIKQIEANPTLMERIFSLIRAGSISALEAALNHPVANFVISGVKDWQETGKC